MNTFTANEVKTIVGCDQIWLNALQKPRSNDRSPLFQPERPAVGQGVPNLYSLNDLLKIYTIYNLEKIGFRRTFACEAIQ